MTKDTKLRQQIEDTVRATVLNPSIPGSYATIQPVTDAVMKQVTPRIDQIAGTGPWYLNLQIQGLIVATISRLAAHFGYAIPQEMHGYILNAIIALGPYVGLSMIGTGVYLKKLLRH